MMGRNYLLTIQSRYTLHARKEGGNPKGWDSPLKFIMTTDSHIKIVEYIYENVIEYVEVSQSQLQTAYAPFIIANQWMQIHSHNFDLMAIKSKPQ